MEKIHLKKIRGGWPFSYIVMFYFLPEIYGVNSKLALMVSLVPVVRFLRKVISYEMGRRKL